MYKVMININMLLASNHFVHEIISTSYIFQLQKVSFYKLLSISTYLALSLREARHQTQTLRKQTLETKPCPYICIIKT